MKGSRQNSHFRKTEACPSSETLMHYCNGKLFDPSFALVGYHLNACEFCNAEIALLSRYPYAQERKTKAPEIPQHLRILAESILNRN